MTPHQLQIAFECCFVLILALIVDGVILWRRVQRLERQQRTNREETYRAFERHIGFYHGHFPKRTEPIWQEVDSIPTWGSDKAARFYDQDRA